MTINWEGRLVQYFPMMWWSTQSANDTQRSSTSCLGSCPKCLHNETPLVGSWQYKAKLDKLSSTSPQLALMMLSQSDDHTWESWTTCSCYCMMHLPDMTPLLAVWLWGKVANLSSMSHSLMTTCSQLVWSDDHKEKPDKLFLYLSNESPWQDTTPGHTTLQVKAVNLFGMSDTLLAKWLHRGYQTTCVVGWPYTGKPDNLFGMSDTFSVE